MTENTKFRWLCSLLVLVILVGKVVPQGFQFTNPIRFPYSNTGNPYIGMFVAIAVPIDLRGPADLFFSANFESSYGLPSNQSLLSYPPIYASTRQLIYQLLESKIKGYGYPGKKCLQRAICEAAEYTTENYGVLGDILHVLLTPSTSRNDTNVEDYAKSEEYGRTKGNCKKYKKNCGLSILNLFSVVKDTYAMYNPNTLKKEISML
uniref:Uncharacterized protein LOC114338049 n=1 Tax=Diabrotica virgifera virgifera TaxID=50390 RepID=A0A6P7GH36_DIAVI